MRLCVTLNATLEEYLYLCCSMSYRIFLCPGVYLPTLSANIHCPGAHALCHLDWTSCQVYAILRWHHRRNLL